ncbi:MAG: hypothetical protein AAF206_10060, partial [Bacteroidota bacterium]
SFRNTSPSQNIILPTNLHTLSNLKELDIRDLNVAIFSNFEQLVSLEKLRLENVLWVRIPQGADQWPKLKSLEVSEVELRGDLPDMFRGMNSLTSIYIRETPLTTESQQHIFQSPALEELTFSFCEMGQIPDNIGNLASLKKLVIATEQNTLNHPIVLPETLKDLHQLESIYFSAGLDQFPIALLGLQNTIQSISLKDNLESIPPEIGDFSVLKRLSLQQCGLSSLPSEIQNLANSLENLDLRGNQLSESMQQQIREWLPETDVRF